MRLSAAACAAACWLLVWATSAHAVNWTLTPGYLQGQYHGALWRDRIEETSLDVDARVAGVWGLGAGLSRTQIVYQFGIPDYQQDARFLYGDLTYPLAGGAGILTGNLGVQQLLDSDHGDAGDGMRALGSQLSYSSLDATRDLDLGYAESHYANSGVVPSGFVVRQWTPTIGWAVRPERDWIRLRGYFIHCPEPACTAAYQRTAAADFKWTHATLHTGLTPQSVAIRLLTGTRVYALDRDSNAVLNLADPQTGAWSLEGYWSLSGSLGLVVLFASERFQELWLGQWNSYTRQLAYFGLSGHW
jgi:hypothetical protein